MLLNNGFLLLPSVLILLALHKIYRIGLSYSHDQYDWECSMHYRNQKKPIKESCRNYEKCTLQFMDMYSMEIESCVQNQVFDETVGNCVVLKNVSQKSRCYEEIKNRTIRSDFMSFPSFGNYPEFGFGTPSKRSYKYDMIPTDEAQAVVALNKQSIYDNLDEEEYEAPKPKPAGMQFSVDEWNDVRLSPLPTLRPLPPRPSHEFKPLGQNLKPKTTSKPFEQNVTLNSTLNPFGKTHDKHKGLQRIVDTRQTENGLDELKLKVNKTIERGGSISKSKGLKKITLDSTNSTHKVSHRPVEFESTTTQDGLQDTEASKNKLGLGNGTFSMVKPQIKPIKVQSNVSPSPLHDTGKGLKKIIKDNTTDSM